MMKRVFLGLALAALLAGCATPPPAESEVVTRNNAAGDVLAALMTARGVAGAPVVVASAVEIDQLDKSSNFGRMIGEQISSRLAYTGIPVVELKLRSALYMSKDSGELMLSRELKDLTLQHRAAVVVVGTYSVASQDVMVTLKAVNVETNSVVAAHSYSIPKGQVSKMLKP